MNGYLRVASLMPDVKVGNPKFNVEAIKEEILKANTLSVKLCVLPELCITGNNLGALYHDRTVLNESLDALYSLLVFSSEIDIVIIVSLPFEFNSNVYDVAAVIKGGLILGFVPRTMFNVSDLNSKYFNRLENDYDEIELFDSNRNISYKFPFSKSLEFYTASFSFSIIFNGNLDCKFNSKVLCNLMSIPETIDVDSSIREIKALSLTNNSIVITTSPGTSESTEVNTYFGRSFICEYGDIIVKNDILTNHVLISDIDLDKKNLNNIITDYKIFKRVHFSFTNYIFNNVNEKLFREFDKYPYINKKINPYNYSMHIVNILSVALAKRLLATHSQNIIIGVSGGLDSTFALLVAKKTIEFMGLNADNIKAISMPGFGTTSNSNENIKNLLASLDIKLNIIDITNAVNIHFNDIMHDQLNTNSTFENAQARERTQILMDLANDYNGIVIGTGDLSEIALGFATYNGDHMSMYNLNGSVPKTLIRYILNAIADENLKKNNNMLLADTLKNILHTKISPELLPTDNGILVQKTEDILGNYEIHDFILYNYLKFNYSYDKLFDLTLRTFIYNNLNELNYTEEYIKNCLDIFFDKFYKSQYKRNAAPPSPSIGLPNLDSHNSFYMPGDVEIDSK